MYDETICRFQVLAPDGSSAGENEVRVFDAERRLVHFLRNVAPPGPPVTEADIAAFRERALRSAPAPMQAQLAAAYAEIPFPKTKPPIRDVFVASDGSVWVMHWPSSNGAAVPVRVYAADGTRTARLELPSALVLQDVRSDSVLGLWSDSLGVESIRMYQLIRRQD